MVEEERPNGDSAASRSGKERLGVGAGTQRVGPEASHERGVCVAVDQLAGGRPAKIERHVRTDESKPYRTSGLDIGPCALAKLSEEPEVNVQQLAVFEAVEEVFAVCADRHKSLAVERRRPL